jgi:hypothetical protein
VVRRKSFTLFTEKAGNFQEDNFGKGGAAGDALQADAQVGAGLTPITYLNNAAMSTPTDGSRPRMVVYLWGSSGGPYVDADFDAEVLLHEYTHGVFRRLTGTSGSVQSGALNEGNSDFFSLNYHTPAGASPDGAGRAGPAPRLSRTQRRRVASWTPTLLAATSFVTPSAINASAWGSSLVFSDSAIIVAPLSDAARSGKESLWRRNSYCAEGAVRAAPERRRKADYRRL